MRRRTFRGCSCPELCPHYPPHATSLAFPSSLGKTFLPGRVYLTPTSSPTPSLVGPGGERLSLSSTVFCLLAPVASLTHTPAPQQGVLLLLISSLTLPWLTAPRLGRIAQAWEAVPVCGSQTTSSSTPMLGEARAPSLWRHPKAQRERPDKCLLC